MAQDGVDGEKPKSLLKVPEPNDGGADPEAAADDELDDQT